MSKIIFNMNAVPVPMGLYNFFGNINKAMVVQHIHYWCERSEEAGSEHKFNEGHYWTYNTFEELAEMLPIGITTIKKVIKELERDGYIFSSNFNKKKFDRTKWYRVNYEKLESEINDTKVQMCTDHSTDVYDGKYTSDLTIPKTSTKTSSKDLKDTAMPEQPTKTKQSPAKEKEDKRYTALRDGGIVSTIYANAYEQVFKESHKDVEENELKRLEGLIEDFIEEHGIDHIDFEEMLIYYFKNLTNKNIGTIHYLAKDNHGYAPILKRILDDYTDAY